MSHATEFAITRISFLRAKDFLRNVDQSAGPDACWPFKGYRDDKNYGYVGVNNVNVAAHRLAFFLEHEDLASGLVIRHSCDNPPCCNPRHLLKGTVADNVNDMVQRGRNSGGRKLTEAGAREIRALYASGLSQGKVAKRMGVCQTTVSMVVLKKIWSQA